MFCLFPTKIRIVTFVLQLYRTGTRTAAAAGKAELRANRWIVRQTQNIDTNGNSNNDNMDNAAVTDNTNVDGQAMVGPSSSAAGAAARTRLLPPEMTAENLLRQASTIICSFVSFFFCSIFAVFHHNRLINCPPEMTAEHVLR